MCYVSPFHLGEFPGVPLWSLALLCVAVGGPLVALVIWQDIRNIVMINPLYQNNLSFTVDVADFFVERGISQVTSITVPARDVSLFQFFGSRILLLSLDMSSDRPLKVLRLLTAIKVGQERFSTLTIGLSQIFIVVFDVILFIFTIFRALLYSRRFDHLPKTFDHFPLLWNCLVRWTVIWPWSQIMVQKVLEWRTLVSSQVPSWLQLGNQQIISFYRLLVS